MAKRLGYYTYGCILEVMRKLPEWIIVKLGKGVPDKEDTLMTVMVMIAAVNAEGKKESCTVFFHKLGLDAGDLGIIKHAMLSSGWNPESSEWEVV